MTTNPNLDQAREWAKDTYTANLFADTWQLELAEVINALPETIVDGEELRSQIERVRRAADDFTEDSYARGMLKALEAFECLLPAPDPRKTLADMTSEERAACQWMQADFDGARVVLTTVTDAVVSYLWPNGTPGTRSSYYRDMFTPLPDLPRMVWPDEHHPTPRSLADTKWDDNVHPYMEAVTVSGRRHILLAPMGDTAVSENTLLVADHDGGIPVLVPADGLYPTGRYALLYLPEEQTTNHYTTQEKK